MRGLLLLLLALPGIASAAPILVAVEQGSSSVGSAADVVTQLNDDTWFDFTATQVTATSIDSAAELAAYDVVIIGDSGYNDADWSATMASALKTWTSGGGGVVAVGWVDFGIRASSPRDSDLDEVVPIDAYPDSVNYFCNPGSGSLYLSIGSTSHAVTTGLTSTSITTTSADIEFNPLTIDSGATLL